MDLSCQTPGVSVGIHCSGISCILCKSVLCCLFYYLNFQSKTWYDVVLCENFFQDLLWNGTQDNIPKLHCVRVMRASRIPPWKQAVCDFLKKNPPPEVEELIQLAHLANVIADPYLQQNGKWLSQRWVAF